MLIKVLALSLLLVSSAHAEAEVDDAPEAVAPKPGQYRAFSSSKRTFSCDVPAAGWPVFEEDTPWGSAAHFLGPVEENGAWRAALHVHFVDKSQPGFVPIEDAVKRARRSDPAAERTATSVRRSRVSGKSARRFEIVETRLTPGERLPAAPSTLHHYVAYVPAGDGYFIVKLSTSRETYLNYKDVFEHVLHSFRINGF